VIRAAPRFMPRTVPPQRSQGLRIEGDPRSHPVWRDETAALLATQRLSSSPMKPAAHSVLHISDQGGDRIPEDHKDVASCEATPHHLTLAAPECYERLGPARADESAGALADHRDGIWRGIAQGIIDVSLDHAPAYAGGKGQNLSGLARRA